jgi:iron complex outermembrane receptor protein
VSHIHLLWTLVFLLLGASVALPETIRGTVSDASGAVIKGAAVTLKAGARVIARTETGPSGEFAFMEALRKAGGRVEAGLYELTAAADGFAPASQALLPQHLEGKRVQLTLEIAPYREAVEIAAGMPLYKDLLDMSGVRESAARDLAEALTVVDGVWKIRKAGIANDLVIRGFQQNNINVIVDGSRTFGACPSHMDPPAQHVDFAEVDHVEITKGAFDVMNQGSLGAVVNIATKSPGLGFSLKPSLSLGSFGYFNPVVGASYGSRRFRVLGGYSYRRSEPYQDGSGRRLTEYAPYSANGKRQRAFEINTGWVETVLSLSDRQEVSLSYTRQQAGLILYPYLTMDSDYDNADRAVVRYGTRDLPSSLRALRLETYLTQVKHFMSDSQRASAMNGAWTMASDATARAVGGRIEADLLRQFTAGIESYYRNWNLTGYMKSGMMTMANLGIPNVDTLAFGSFVDFKHNLADALRLGGGVRFDHAGMRAQAANASIGLYHQFHNTNRVSDNDNYVSGNLRLSAALPHAMELFVGAGSNGRIPDAEERYFSRSAGASPMVGNPLLPITRNTELNLGLNLSPGRFYVRPDFFYSFLSDYIIVNNQPRLNPPQSGIGGSMAPAPLSARSYTNIDARIFGGEMAYGYSFNSALSLSGGGSYSRGRAVRKPSAGVTSPNLPEMPPLRGWAAVRYARRWTFSEFGFVAVNRQPHVDSDLMESPTAGYALLNLKLGITLRRWSASLTVDNLLDRYYFEYLSYYRNPFGAGVKLPEPGRNVFAQVRYSF